MTPLLTTSQAAAILGLKRRQVSSLCAAGTIPAQRAGRDYLIDPREVAKAKDRPKPGRRWPKEETATTP